MSELRAGSYLKLLSNPQLDLMDIVDEQAPDLRKKTRLTLHEVTHVLHSQYPESEEHDDDVTVTFPYYSNFEDISYENTHGWRFGNCNHRRDSFNVEPCLVPSLPKLGVWAHNHSSDPEDWKWHTLDFARFDDVKAKGSDFGLICWDYAVWNELYPGYPDEPRHLVVDDDDLDIDEELVRAYDTIRPAITSNMSLLTTLAELKDVKSLFSEPLAFTNSVVHAIGRKKAAKIGLREILMDPDLLPFIVRSLAKGKLYTEFGLKQAQRDIVSLYSTFLSLDSTVREILSMTGENTRHYSVPLFEKHEQQYDSFFQDHNWIMQQAWDSVLTRKFVVTMKYTTELVDAFGQSISPNDPELVKLGAVMDKLGLNMNPAILWDVVPFSFVVDYFVGIGDWLERFKRSNLNLTFSVSDSCYSVKRERKTSGYTRRWSSVWDGIDRFPDHPLAACEEYIGGIKFDYVTTEYTRTRFQPTLRMLSGLEAPDFSIPNLGQLKILGSLLTTNIPIFGKRS